MRRSATGSSQRESAAPRRRLVVVVAVLQGSGKISDLLRPGLQGSGRLDEMVLVQLMAIESLPRCCLSVEGQRECVEGRLQAPDEGVNGVLETGEVFLQVYLFDWCHHGSRNQTLLPPVCAVVPHAPAIASTRNRPRPLSRPGSCSSMT